MCLVFVFSLQECLSSHLRHPWMVKLSNQNVVFGNARSSFFYSVHQILFHIYENSCLCVDFLFRYTIAEPALSDT